MKKTTKRKITTTAKRVVKPPSQSVVLSLMALILIVGAPALVSVIDDYTVPFEFESDLSVKSLDDLKIISHQPTKVNGVNTTVEEKATIIRDGNSYSIVHAVTGSYGWIYIKDFDNTMVKDGVSKIVVTTSSPINIDIRFYNGAVFDTFSLSRDDTNTVHTLELSSVDIAKIRSYPVDAMDVILCGVVADDHPFDEAVTTVTVSAYGNVMIPYGEIIIGATGAILIVCALFATPWFGIGGITAKPRRSK